MSLNVLLKIGDILIKGDNVIKKYWNNVKADKNISDNWLRTGDTGYFDNEGYLFLKGRSDEIINVGGEKVMPMDIMPQQLIKSIIAKDLEQMENLGIYEVIEEDMALCEFVCTSKIDVQRVLSEGLELMAEES